MLPLNLSANADVALILVLTPHLVGWKPANTKAFLNTCPYLM